MAKDGSMLNTPTYTWYVAGLVFQWLGQGGLESMGELNRAKAEKFCGAI
jgi:phosphoserine aminotransferase